MDPGSPGFLRYPTSLQVWIQGPWRSDPQSDPPSDHSWCFGQQCMKHSNAHLQMSSLPCSCPILTRCSFCHPFVSHTWLGLFFSASKGTPSLVCVWIHPNRKGLETDICISQAGVLFCRLFGKASPSSPSRCPGHNVTTVARPLQIEIYFPSAASI